MVDSGTAVKMEIDQRRRFDAGLEAIELLYEAGFIIEDFDINSEDPRDHIFQIEADLAIGQETNPLDVLDDENEIGESFTLGLTAGMMIAGGPCGDEDCPRGE